MTFKKTSKQKKQVHTAESIKLTLTAVKQYYDS